ncbi:MAG: LacI family DNA-binding transcriptional regulator [Lentisphaerae bacterium]|nr:LacI family DNA-binding transcriptional regulator [Lentisphaerota bacterium]
MADVAAQTGVSQAAVSYVVNGIAAEKRIPEATQQRIEAACHELGYRRDYLATAMATRQTRVIGMLFANALGEFMNGIIKGAQDYLREHDRHVVLCTCDDDPAVEAADLEMLDHRHADGIICFPVPPPHSTDYWKRALDGERPTVFVDVLPLGIDGDCVRIDDAACGKGAAEHLHRAGIEQTVLLQMPGWSAASIEMRQAGFLTGLRQAGLPAARVVDVGDRQAIHALLQSQEKLGIFAPVSGWLTHMLRPFIRSVGPIGAGVTFASIGRCPEADFVVNSWWVAQQPEKEMGLIAAQQLLHRLEDNQPAPPTLVLPVDWHHNRP